MSCYKESDIEMKNIKCLWSCWIKYEVYM